MTSTPADHPGQPDPLQPVLADLAKLEQVDPADQVPIYERMHSALAEALTGTVDQSASGAGGR